MCGIAGQCALGGKGADEGLVKRLVAGMRYRGPDHAGHFAAPGVALGMARLSIVDVGSGFQPLFNEQGTVALVCNGEIYNHQELRRGLMARGHRFKTGSDCETIVHLYEERGADCLQDLHGMFAFLLWDATRQTLLVARDRIGIKPLYYREKDGVWTFSSEFGPLVRGLGLSPQIDQRILWSFLCIGYPTHETKTLDARIRRVAPGELLEISAKGCARRTYWRPNYLEHPGANGAAVAADIEQLRALMLETLDEHLICEVPSAIMLSGGLDSTSIAVHAKKLGHNLRVITAGYAGDHDCDERQAALATAKRIGLPVEEVILDATDYAQSFASLMRHMDEPVADIASVPQWDIYRRTAELGFKVLHSGLGGDELFFGYGLWNDLSARLEEKSATRAFTTDDESGFYFHPSHRAGRDFLEAAALQPYTGIDAEIARNHDLNKLEGAERVYHLLFKTWLPGNCLHLADRLSMAHSVELRVPFLDDRFVDHVQGLPIAQRFAAGQSKPLLKKLLLAVLGKDFLNRPKRGFTPPGGYVQRLVEGNSEQLLNGHLANTFYDKKILRRLHAEQPGNDIWYRMLVFEKWLCATYAQREAA